MKKSDFTTAIVMELCMWTYSMCMIFCALVSDMLSISGINTQTA